MLSLKNITKTYPGVIALNDVSLDFEDGKVHALLGENGAGKSTLIKIIAGALTPDSGVICISDSVCARITPHTARNFGIAVIYQEQNLVGSLTVAENIYLGRPQSKLFSHRLIEQQAHSLFDEYGFKLNPRSMVMSLSPADQQLVEICKAISNDAKYIIMDEPTASLASHEVEMLFRIIRNLKARGVTVIYISHRLDEVFEVTDTVSILRDGEFVKKLATEETNRQELVNLMVGRELTENYPPRESVIGEVVLKADKLSGNSVENISFELRRGEILGFAGLVGSGRTETAQLICGAANVTSGSLTVNGKAVKLRSPTDTIRAGIGLIPEDRKQQGLILHNSILFNITLICNDKFFRWGLILNKLRKAVAQRFCDTFRIKAPGLNQQTLNLSGGNQQKVVLAKTLAADLEIIFLDEPTRGIDVGAKQEIYQLM
ncbi:MAG: sugar ABC transporter ATP-binding protein, partial [Oscillospiraceae bacterium]|nr:sugar ABC transporter ATP-binding protein [Oscillospiraceae bacterium]